MSFYIPGLRDRGLLKGVCETIPVPTWKGKVSGSLHSSLAAAPGEFLLPWQGRNGLLDLYLKSYLGLSGWSEKFALLPLRMDWPSFCFIEPIGFYRLITDSISTQQPLQEHLFNQKTFSSILEKNQLFPPPATFPGVPCSCSPMKQWMDSGSPLKRRSQPKFHPLRVTKARTLSALAGLQHRSTACSSSQDVSTWPLHLCSWIPQWLGWR